MKIILAIHSFFDRLYRRPLGRLLLSLIMVGGIYLFAFWRMEPAYLINDDTNIAFALAGYRTGTPYGAHPFINILLSLPLSRLYGCFPGVPWWFIAQEAALFLSAIALSMSTLRVCAKRNVHWLFACMLFGVLFIGLLFRPIVRVTFTLTAAALGTAGVALLLCFDRDDPKWQKTLLSIASGLFLAFAFLFRNSTGVAAACFYFAAVLYRIFDAKLYGRAERKRLKHRAYALGVAMLALVACVIGVNRIGINVCNEEGYQAFDEARADFVDYRLRDPYSANPELYASVGWDETLYSLALHWCFMDEHVTTEALTTLAESSTAASLPLTEKLQDVPAHIQKFLENDYFARLMLSLPLASLGALIVLMLFARRRDWLCFAAGVCMLLGAMLLIGYLAYCDRLILRTFRLVLTPACFAAALFAARILPRSDATPNGVPARDAEADAPDAPDVPVAVSPDTPDAPVLDAPAPDAAAVSEKKRLPWRSAISAALCVCLLLFAGLMSGRALMDTLRSDYTDEIASCRAVIDYCIANPALIFIRDTATCSNLDALSVYPDQKPVNLLSWGDTDMLTGVQKAQLDLLGLAAPLRMSAFRQENVRYLGTMESGAYQAFSAYLAARGASLEQTDEAASGVGVFRVVFGNEAP